MKHLQKILLLFVLTVIFSAYSIESEAQTYSVDYNNLTIEQVIRDLRKRTGYEDCLSETGDTGSAAHFLHL